MTLSVMNAWAKNKEIKNIKMIPGGNGDFTRLMGMMVKKNNLGFGFRSWRYALCSSKLGNNKLV